MKTWYASIERMHALYDRLTSQKRADDVEELISIAQVASDRLKKAYDGYNSVLHVLENTTEFIKTTLNEKDEKIRQINLDFEKGIKNLMLPPS